MMKGARYILFLLMITIVFSFQYITAKVKDFNISIIKKYSYEIGNCLVFRGTKKSHLVISYCNGILTFYNPPITVQGTCKYKLIGLNFDKLLNDIYNGTFKNYDTFSNNTVEFQGCKINRDGTAECFLSYGNKTIEVFKNYFESYEVINCTNNTLLFEEITINDAKEELKNMVKLNLIKDYNIGNYTPKIFLYYPATVPFSERKTSFVVVIKERPKEEEKEVNESYIERIREERKRRLLIRRIEKYLILIAPILLLIPIVVLWWKKWKVR